MRAGRRMVRALEAPPWDVQWFGPLAMVGALFSVGALVLGSIWVAVFVLMVFESAVLVMWVTARVGLFVVERIGAAIEVSEDARELRDERD